MNLDFSTNAKKIKHAREAGAVQRCHTQPKIGSYDVAQHTFGMLCILRICYPQAPVDMYHLILGHDIPERKIGDYPATAKWAGLINMDKVEDLEKRILEESGFGVIDNLSASWMRVFKQIDLLELYLWCLDQNSMGNENALVMAKRIELWFDEAKSSGETVVTKLFDECESHPWIWQGEISD